MLLETLIMHYKASADYFSPAVPSESSIRPQTSSFACSYLKLMYKAITQSSDPEVLDGYETSAESGLCFCNEVVEIFKALPKTSPLPSALAQRYPALIPTTPSTTL